MVKDPVCKMQIDKRHPPASTVYKGKEYYFCCEDCKLKFESDPEKYLQDEDEES